MKVLSVSTLVLLASCPITLQAQKLNPKNLRSGTAVDDAQHRRREKGGGKKGGGKKGGAKKGGGNGQGAAGGEVIFDGPCEPFYEPDGFTVTQAVQASIVSGAKQDLHDSICNESPNDCGCCRYFTSLMMCDESNDLPHLPCVCTANSPTAPITDSPTVSPTGSPTADNRAATPGPGQGISIVTEAPTTEANQCLKYDPNGAAEPHPYQMVAAAYKTPTCFAADGCSTASGAEAGTCCSQFFCICQQVAALKSADDFCVPAAV
jgi:hypothetical protein